MMKRCALVLGSAFLATVLAGCDSGGIQEGTAKEEGPPQNQDFQKLMQANSKNMTLKGGPPAGLQRTQGGAPPPGAGGMPGAPGRP
jgi:hypothetical protein